MKSLKGEEFEEETFETTVDMDMDAFIPATYIKNEVQKLDIYKRIADIERGRAYGYAGGAIGPLR